MNKIFIIVVIGLLLVGSVSAYFCIKQEDNDAVKNFKSNMNLLALKKDINNGITPDGLQLKLKYFNPCK